MVHCSITNALPGTHPGERRWRASGGSFRVLTVTLAFGLLVALPYRSAVLLLMVAPVLEEIVFRLGLQQRLLMAGLGPAAANLLTALAFAAVHAFSRSWVLGALVLLPALVIGWIYQGRRSVPACIAAHAGMNLLWLIAAAAWPVRAQLIN